MGSVMGCVLCTIFNQTTLNIVLLGAFIHALQYLINYPNCCGVYQVSQRPESQKPTTFGRIYHFVAQFIGVLLNVWSVIFIIFSFLFIMLPTWIILNIYERVIKRNSTFAEATKSDNDLKQKADQPKRVAVIGCGPSGIISAKVLRDYGHNVTIFEKTNEVGGSFWALQYENGTLTTSNYLTAFSCLEFERCDFNEHENLPKMNINGKETDPDKVGIMPSFDEYANYMRRFMKVFSLYEITKFNCEIIDIEDNNKDNKENNNGDNNISNFTIKYIMNNDGDNIKMEQFDHVVVATGIANNNDPNIPYELRPYSRWNCNVIHSSEYRTAKDEKLFINKNVLCIGCGESGSDIAYDIARVAKKMILSCGRGPGTLFPRYYSNNPVDVDTTRMNHKCRNIEWYYIPLKIILWFIQFTPGCDDFFVLSKILKLDGHNLLKYSPLQRFGTKSAKFLWAVTYHGLEYKQAGIKSYQNNHGDNKEIVMVTRDVMKDKRMMKGDKDMMDGDVCMMNGGMKDKKSMMMKDEDNKEESMEMKKDPEHSTITVAFDDGTKFTDVETIICCTGYKTNSFTFLSNILSRKECLPCKCKVSGKPINPRNLYKHMFVPALGDKLVFIGLNRPAIGSVLPISELTARYYGEIISGFKKLPNLDDMNMDIIYKRKLAKEYFPVHHDRIPNLVDFVETMDEMGKLVGVQPNLYKLFIFQPFLWFKVICGPIRTIHWRIFGRHKYDLDKIKFILGKNPTSRIAVLTFQFFWYWVAELIRQF